MIGDCTRRMRVGSLRDVSPPELIDAIGKLGHMESAVD